jgi:tRNA(Ile)-lysidine synthase
VVNRQGGRKKLKDYFIDQKVPREKRDEVLLLAKGSEVFWIIGYRLSERCKVTEDTEKVLEISYFPEEV